MMATRHSYAKNRWHSAWVLLRECVLHPNSDHIIHIGKERKLPETLVDRVTVSLDSHLTEYGDGIAAWKDRDPPGRALAQVAVVEVIRWYGEQGIDLLE